MNIMPVNTYNNRKTPAFKTYSTTVYNKCIDTTYKTSTSFFREDINWKTLRNFLVKKYADTNEVNTIIHAGSAGEEALSLAVLYKELGEFGKRFKKIISKDFDKDAVKTAKSGIFNITPEEFTRIKKFTNNNPDKYFNIIKENGHNNGITLMPKDELKDMISFSCADIISDVRNIPENNTVLLCRNFWPYLDKEDVYRLAGDLRDRLKPSSTVVIGAFDAAKEIDKTLLLYGFKPTTNSLVFEKREFSQSSVFSKYSAQRTKSDIS